ncbi:hypothetical protein ACN28G_20845 [Micromonospora sp. WMMA1923]|uniref:hypothetical protein n=1 Tax=Micromonospora sp. WMMA1923 TaxID=3404125 RepID=UPI003B94551D
MPVPRPDQIPQLQDELNDRREELHRLLLSAGLPETFDALTENQQWRDNFRQAVRRYQFVVEMRDRTSDDRPDFGSEESTRFESYQRGYSTIYADLQKYVGYANTWAHQPGTWINDAQRTGLSRANALLAEVESRERALRDGRRAWGVQACTELRSQVNVANQLPRFEQTSGQSLGTLYKLVRNADARRDTSSVEVEYGQTALLSRHYREAACSELTAALLVAAHRDLYDRRHKAGDLITIKDFAEPAGPSSARRDHVVLVVGPPNHPESVYVEPWSKTPTVTGALNYSMAQPHAYDDEYQREATGKDYAAKATQRINWSWVNARHVQPANPPAGVNSTADLPYARHVYDVQHAFHSPPSSAGQGRALTQDNLRLTAANNFGQPVAAPLAAQFATTPQQSTAAWNQVQYSATLQSPQPQYAPTYTGYPAPGHQTATSWTPAQTLAYLQSQTGQPSQQQGGSSWQPPANWSPPSQQGGRGQRPG